MGSHSAETHFDGTLTKDQLVKQYNSHVADLTREYGTDPYNGTLSTCNGLEVSDKVFDTYKQAMDYILDNTSKWESAMAVKCKNIKTVKKSFTFGEKKEQSFNNAPYRMAYPDRFGGNATLVAANELTKTEGARVIKLAKAAKDAEEAMAQEGSPLHPMLARLTNPNAEVTAELFTAIKRRSASYRKLAAKHLKAKAALDAEVVALTAKYCTERTETGKPLWVVGGWAAC
jgi:hypothetical protein